MTVYTVAQLNNYIRGMMDEDVILAGLFTEGELSNFKEHSSGHMYFTLKDKDAAISGVMFRGNAQNLEFTPKTGMKVVVYGRVSVYEKTGTMQLYVEMMQPSGLGALFLAFSRLKAKLEAEGLFDATRKRPLPELPACVGVVTSADGAALRDIIQVAGRRNPGVRLILAPATVQGDGAEATIAAAIELLNAHGAADVMIVGRGGGSMEDLWAFNEEVVARAVAASGIPVVSAVGHETDFTICDFAADMRAPTPSAAAELCIPAAADIRGHVKWLAGRVSGAVEDLLGEHIGTLTRCLTKMPGPAALVDMRAGHAANLSRRINREIDYKLEKAEAHARAAIQALDLAAPLNVLKRGYAILHVGGEIVRSVADIAADGGEMAVRLADGAVHGSITNVVRD